MRAMRTLLAGLTGLAALTLGCGTGRATPSAPTPQPASEQAEKAQHAETAVQIDNQNFNDMNIYLLEGGSRVFIGSASGLTKTTLLIPHGSVGANWEVRLIADPIGSSTPIRSGALLVAPAQSVHWTIGADQEASFASAG
jgi:hypothetical protein